MRSEYIVHRHRRRKETLDPYDGFASKYPSTATTNNKLSDYWSNGTTSLLTMNTPTLLPDTSPVLLTSTPPTTTTATSKSSLLVKNSIVSGSIAGMTSCIMFHPLDVIRTKMQSSTMISSSSSSSAAAIHNNGPLAIMSQTVRQGGVRALYTGLSLPLAAQALYKSTIFTSNQLVQRLLTEHHIHEQRKLGNFTQTYQLSYLDHFICGAVSGAFNAFLFVAPVEYVRNQLILLSTNNNTSSKQHMPFLRTSNQKGPLHVIQHTIQTTGTVTALWRGAGITVMRDSIGCGSFFFMYQLGQTIILPTILPNNNHNNNNHNIQLLHKVGSGFLAGFGYWFASLPLDAIKTLIQTNQAKNTNQVISTLIRTHGGILPGITQLYKGWQVAFGRGSPSAAVTITTYSLIFQTLQQQQQQP